MAVLHRSDRRRSDAARLAGVLAIDLVAPAEPVRAAQPHLAAGRGPATVLLGSILGHHLLPLHDGDYATNSGRRAKGDAFLVRWLPGLIDRWAARNWRPGGGDAGRIDHRGREG